MTKEEIYNEVEKFFQKSYEKQERTIKLYTGIGGYDLFQNAFEEALGYKRLYISKKVLRILRRLKSPIKYSIAKKQHYKLIKNK